MAREIKVAVEGPQAESAMAELLAIEGVEGRVETAANDELRKDGGALVIVVAIVAIASGLANVVDKILAWRDRIKAAAAEDEARRLNVVLEDGRGNRLRLNDATPEEITAALETLADSGGRD